MPPLSPDPNPLFMARKRIIFRKMPCWPGLPFEILQDCHSSQVNSPFYTANSLWKEPGCVLGFVRERLLHTHNCHSENSRTEWVSKWVWLCVSKIQLTFTVSDVTSTTHNALGDSAPTWQSVCHHSPCPALCCIDKQFCQSPSNHPLHSFWPHLCLTGFCAS